MNTIYRRLSDHLLTVHCRRCDHAGKYKVLTILEHKKVMCSRCGSLNAVETAGLEQKISALQGRRDAQRAAAPAAAEAG